MFHNLTTFQKTEWENQVLSVGRSFLPPCAIAVLDGNDATPEYWDFIAEQFAMLDDESRED